MGGGGGRGAGALGPAWLGSRGGEDGSCPAGGGRAVGWGRAGCSAAAGRRREETRGDHRRTHRARPPLTAARRGRGRALNPRPAPRVTAPPRAGAAPPRGTPTAGRGRARPSSARRGPRSLGGNKEAGHVSSLNREPRVCSGREAAGTTTTHGTHTGTEAAAAALPAPALLRVAAPCVAEAGEASAAEESGRLCHPREGALSPPDGRGSLGDIPPARPRLSPDAKVGLAERPPRLTAAPAPAPRAGDNPSWAGGGGAWAPCR